MTKICEIQENKENEKFKALKNGLIEIKRNYVNFFTEIYVYDNTKEFPTFDVYKQGAVEEDDFVANCFVVYFKDLETNELLKFSVDKDSELLSENVKTKNTYLIKQMQYYVRANHYIFEEYYNKNSNILNLVEYLNINKYPFEFRYKMLDAFYHKTDEGFMYDNLILSYADSTQKLMANYKVFKMLICKCMLWKSNEEYYEYWKEELYSGLCSISRIIFENRLLDYKEYMFNGITEESLKRQCKNAIKDMVDNNYLTFIKQGKPCKIDYKIFAEKYNKFIKDYFEYVDKIRELYSKFNYLEHREYEEKLESLIDELIF